MTGTEYELRMRQLAFVAGMVEEIPLDELSEVVSKSEALGPLLATTKWIEGGADNLRDARELIDAFAKVQSAVRAIKTRGLERMAKREAHRVREVSGT